LSRARSWRSSAASAIFGRRWCIWTAAAKGKFGGSKQIDLFVKSAKDPDGEVKSRPAAPPAAKTKRRP